MNETLVYDAARDGGGGITIAMVAAACVVLGLALIAFGTWRATRDNPVQRRRGLIRVGLTTVLAIAILAGLQVLTDTSHSGSVARAQTIDGVVGSVTPTLIRVGGMKIMIACRDTDTSHCPGLRPGDYARAEYIDDSGPETDALATRIYKRAKP